MLRNINAAPAEFTREPIMVDQHHRGDIIIHSVADPVIATVNGVVMDLTIHPNLIDQFAALITPTTPIFMYYSDIAIYSRMQIWIYRQVRTSAKGKIIEHAQFRKDDVVPQPYITYFDMQKAKVKFNMTYIGVYEGRNILLTNKLHDIEICSSPMQFRRLPEHHEVTQFSQTEEKCYVLARNTRNNRECYGELDRANSKADIWYTCTAYPFELDGDRVFIIHSGIRVRQVDKTIDFERTTFDVEIIA